MSYQFDNLIDRRNTESIKWNCYDADVLPLWVADMDFESPREVIAALRQRIDHGIFGYGQELPGLRGVIVDRLYRRYGWQIAEDALVFIPGVIAGFNLSVQAFTRPGEAVLVQTPVYPPFLCAAQNAGARGDEMELTCLEDGSYGIDFDRFAQAFTPSTRVFILCNPHNPVGRVFRRDELERMASICLEREVIICSDEIHSDLVFSGHPHIPMASLSPEIAQQTITLMAPSKTYNIAGLDCALAIIPNPDLRRRFEAAFRGVVPHVGLIGSTACMAAYRYGDTWLAEVMNYLQGNRDFLHRIISDCFPGLKMAPAQGTYLAWIDCRSAGIPGNPSRFFLEEARVALNDGCSFGTGGEGFVRLNFACPRRTLNQALDRMQGALARIK
jgi:cystathionine beta-lyase